MSKLFRQKICFFFKASFNKIIDSFDVRALIVLTGCFQTKTNIVRRHFSLIKMENEVFVPCFLLAGGTMKNISNRLGQTPSKDKFFD